MSEVRPATGASLSGKVNKDDVRYRHCEQCQACDYFMAGQCRIVEGSIDPESICDKWVINASPLSKHKEFYMDEYAKAKGGGNA